jgi:hypothetical protein
MVLRSFAISPERIEAWPSWYAAKLANLRHTLGRPRICMADRSFWLALPRLWPRWADVLVIVKPDTVVRWHRAGFRLFWRWKSWGNNPGVLSMKREQHRDLLSRQRALVDAELV